MDHGATEKSVAMVRSEVLAVISLALQPKNFWKVVNYRRPKKCTCISCELWRKTSFPAPCLFAYVAWEVEVENLVTTEGKNDLLTNYFKGAAYTAAFYVGLVTNTGFTAYAAGDTAAQIGGTNGWTESVVYSNANRVTWTGGSAAAGSIDNSAAQASFNINASDTIRGGFLDTSNVKSGTAGKLYGEADFGTGNRAVLNGDTLQITVTLTV